MRLGTRTRRRQMSGRADDARDDGARATTSAQRVPPAPRRGVHVFPRTRDDARFPVRSQRAFSRCPSSTPRALSIGAPTTADECPLWPPRRSSSPAPLPGFAAHAPACPLPAPRLPRPPSPLPRRPCPPLPRSSSCTSTSWQRVSPWRWSPRTLASPGRAKTAIASTGRPSRRTRPPSASCPSSSSPTDASSRSPPPSPTSSCASPVPRATTTAPPPPTPTSTHPPCSSPRPRTSTPPSSAGNPRSSSLSARAARRTPPTPNSGRMTEDSASRDISDASRRSSDPRATLSPPLVPPRGDVPVGHAPSDRHPRRVDVRGDARRGRVLPQNQRFASHERRPRGEVAHG